MPLTTLWTQVVVMTTPATPAIFQCKIQDLLFYLHFANIFRSDFGMEYTGSSYEGEMKNGRYIIYVLKLCRKQTLSNKLFELMFDLHAHSVSRMESKGEYTLPPSLGTKYEGEMKDGM